MTGSYSKLSTKFGFCNSPQCKQRLDFSDLIVGQTRIPMLAIKLSVFVCCVFAVLAWSPKPQMIRVAASWIVSTGAVVKDTKSVFYWSLVDHPRGSMGPHTPSSNSGSYHSIPIVILGTSPQPTTFCFFDSSPKPVREGLGESEIKHPLRNDVGYFPLGQQLAFDDARKFAQLLNALKLSTGNGIVRPACVSVTLDVGVPANGKVIGVYANPVSDRTNTKNLHAVRNFSVVQNPRGSIGGDVSAPFASTTDSSLAIITVRSRPYPARLGFSNFAQESFNEGQGQSFGCKDGVRVNYDGFKCAVDFAAGDSILVLHSSSFVCSVPRSPAAQTARGAPSTFSHNRQPSQPICAYA